MEILNSTVYDKKRLVTFTRFTMLNKTLIWIFLSVSTAVVALCYLFQLYIIERNSTISFAFYTVLALDVFYIIITFLVPAITIKKNKNLDLQVNYVFKENSLALTAETKLGTESSELPYGNITKALEYKDNIYLYLNSNQAFLVDKAGFSGNGLDDFKALISNKVKKNNLNTH